MQVFQQGLLKRGAVALFVFCCVLPVAAAKAEDQYLIVPLASLEQVEPKEPLLQHSNWLQWGELFSARLDSPDGQAYLSRRIPEKFQNRGITRMDGPFISPATSPANENDALFNRFANDLAKVDDDMDYLVVRIDGKSPTQVLIRGTHTYDPESQDFTFDIDWNKHYSKEQNSFAKAVFLLCERDYYADHTDDVPGAPFFAHLAREAQKKINAEFGMTQPADDQLAAPRAGGMSTRENRNLVRSFDLLSGSRAIEQNLELDAVLNAWKQEQRTVDIADITGITVAEIDWEPHIRDLPETKLDRLVSYVPADQHIIVFPDFRSAHKFARLTEQSGIPVLQFLNYRNTSSDKRTFQRYQRQLGLSLDSLSELLGPMLIDSVAVTGGDLYFPTGTDITILFETKNADALQTLLLGQMTLQFADDKTVGNPKDGDSGVQYISFLNQERSASAFLAKVDANTVVVSNSLLSLRQILETKAKKNESLADLPEYRFFRDRYKVGDASESVFAILSDATIRRWCGPQWRIAASRRLRQQAILGQMQAEHAADIVNGNNEQPWPVVFETQITSGEEREDETRCILSPTGVFNTKYGTYQFLTPIVELDIGKVTEEERRAYDQWRDEYEGRWRRNFDPIGIRITLGDTMMASDVTVMPINVRTNREFAQMLGFSTGMRFSPDQSVYGTPLQFIIAINPESQQFRRNANLAEQMAGGVSLGWIGNHATVFFDDDPFWLELLDASQKNYMAIPTNFLLTEGNITRLPIGVEVASSNPLRLATFLTGLRGMVEQSAPGLTQWEALQYRDVPYVKISPRDDGGMGIPDNFAIYTSHRQ
ncbi:MAG: hypothetical protein FWH27_08760 [Planctomycetaceae bacterium]|nr:hypothetical protein [Planctomycetaceae bacterium]